MQTLRWLFENDFKTAEYFYDNKTEADLLLQCYLKIEAIQAGTDEGTNKKLLGGLI